MYRKFFKIIVVFFITFIILFINLVYVYSDDELEDISNNIDYSVETSSSTSEISSLNSKSCIVIDRLTKTILYGKNEKQKVKMASTTKIMTAIIVIENGELNNIVTISKKSANTGGSKLGLKPGDKITVLNLLYGLMLCSGNDAAVALAEEIGGNIENFSKLMNTKARKLNLTNTNFESPHGLDSDNHYTTAYELAILTDYALKNKVFSDIVGTKSITININGQSKIITNTNELLGNLYGVYGVKTGFTNGANRCLVTSCKRGDLDIICVVLGADTKKFRTQDSIKLIEYTFNNYEYYNIKELIEKDLDSWKKNNPYYITILKGKDNTLCFNTSHIDTPIIPIKKDLLHNLNTDIKINNILKAPISINTIIGKIDILSGERIIFSSNIICIKKIEKKNIYDYLFYFIKTSSTVLEKSIII